MEVTGLNKYYHTGASSKKAGTKCNSDTGISTAEVFKNEVTNWEEKIKEKINEDLENDREKNIKMSEKQWNTLVNKVDSAINAHNQDIKTDIKVDCSKPNDKDKQLYDDFFERILKEKEKYQLSTKGLLSSSTSDKL